LGLNIPQAMFVLVIQNGGTDAAAGAGAAADSGATCACHSSTDWRHCVTQAVSSATSTALAVDSGLNIDRKSCIQ